MSTHHERPPTPAGAPQGAHGPPGAASVPVWAIGPVITRADIPLLCARLTALVQANRDAEAIVCDVGAVTDPDAVTVAALARLQLTARRLGRRMWLDRACPELLELLELTGLCEVLPLRAGLGSQSGRQAEQREQPLGVEEGVEPGDPAR